MRGRRGCDEEMKSLKGEDNETQEDEERVVRLTCKSVRGQVHTGANKARTRQKKKFRSKRKTTMMMMGTKVGGKSTRKPICEE